MGGRVWFFLMSPLDLGGGGARKFTEGKWNMLGKIDVVLVIVKVFCLVVYYTSTQGF